VTPSGRLIWAVVLRISDRRATTWIGTLPPVGALEVLRGATGGDGFVHRVRSNPWALVAVAAGTILLLAWIGWAIYVTSDRGAREGLGVVIAWPAMLAVLALISLPFIGGYLLIRRLSVSEDDGATDTTESESADADPEAKAPAG
jgi:hypothetical protein